MTLLLNTSSCTACFLYFIGAKSTVCLGSGNIFFVFSFICVTKGAQLKGVAESSLLSKNEPLTPNIDKIMAV